MARIGIGNGHAAQTGLRLSPGEQICTGLFTYSLHQPEVLLLDEPYQGFDWETYLRFWELVGDLRSRGKAIVVITHLVFEQDRFDVLADLKGGTLQIRATGSDPVGGDDGDY